MEKRNSSARMESLKKFMKANALYVVLITCLLITGLAVVLIFSGEDGGESVNRSGDERIQAVGTRTPAPTASPTPQISNSPAETVSTAIPSPTPTLAPTPTAQARLLSPPVSGSIVWGCATDELIYSETLKQWMTHPAVDIAAKQGEAVHAVASGTVEFVGEDDALGFMVRLRHQNGHESVYACLKDLPELAEGESVKAGQQIAEVGNSGISECSLSFHLHFEYIVDGNNVDPTKYVLFTE